MVAIAAAGLAVSLAGVAAGPVSAAPAHPAAPVRPGATRPAGAGYSTVGGLSGVAVASRSSAWAVGHTGVTAPKVLMLHWNGHRWSRVTRPRVLTGSGELLAVKVVSPRNAWAVGNTGSPVHPHTLILHWNGTAWSAVTKPAPVRNGSLSAVTANARGGWAVGYHSTGPAVINTAPLFFRLSGSKWSRVDPKFGAGSGVAMDGVATTTAGKTFSTGLFTGMITGVLARWSGSSWGWVRSFPEQGTYHWLSSIAAGPHGTALAVGTNTAVAGGGIISIRWTGSRWVKAPGPAPADAQAVTFAPGGTAWSAGDSFSGSRDHTLILRWNGRRWTRVASPATAAQLDGLGFATARYGWAVGFTDSTSGRSKTYIAHWNGHAWS